MKKDKTIKAEIWKLRVCGSVIEMVHNNYRTITEIYIPSEKIALNIIDEGVNCFKFDGANRYTKENHATLSKSIVIPSSLVKIFKQYVELREEILRESKNILFQEIGEK